MFWNIIPQHNYYYYHIVHILKFFFLFVSFRGDGHLPTICETIGLLWKARLWISEDSVHWTVWAKRLHLWLHLWLGWQADSKLHFKSVDSFCKLPDCITFNWLFLSAHTSGVCPYRLWSICCHEREPSSQRPALTTPTNQKSGMPRFVFVCIFVTYMRIRPHVCT